MKAITKKETNNGFTLLELLVTIAITAMVLTMIYGVLISSLNAKRCADETIVANQIGQAILTMIATDLRGLLVYDLEEEPLTGEDDQTSNGIDADSISFISAMDSKLLRKSPSDICRITYKTIEGDVEGLMTLVRTEQAYTSAGDGDVIVSSRLYDKIRSFNITYMDMEGEEHESIDEFDEGFLPVAVKVELTLESDTESMGNASPNRGEEPPIYTFSTLVFLPTAADVDKAKKDELEGDQEPVPIRSGNPVR